MDGISRSSSTLQLYMPIRVNRRHFCSGHKDKSRDDDDGDAAVWKLEFRSRSRSQSRERVFGPGLEVRSSVVTGLVATFRSRHVSTLQFRSGLVFGLGFGIHVLSRFQFRCWKIWF